MRFEVLPEVAAGTVTQVSRESVGLNDEQAEALPVEAVGDGSWTVPVLVWIGDFTPVMGESQVVVSVLAHDALDVAGGRNIVGAARFGPELAAACDVVGVDVGVQRIRQTHSQLTHQAQVTFKLLPDGINDHPCLRVQIPEQVGEGRGVVVKELAEPNGLGFVLGGSHGVSVDLDISCPVGVSSSLNGNCAE